MKYLLLFLISFNLSANVSVPNGMNFNSFNKEYAKKLMQQNSADEEKKNLELCKQRAFANMFHKASIGKNHVVFDLDDCYGFNPEKLAKSLKEKNFQVEIFYFGIKGVSYYRVMMVVW
jgi:hypothetical protein